MNIVQKWKTLFVSIGFMVPFVALFKLFMIFGVLNISPNWKAVLATACGSLPVYLIDRVRLPDEDQNNSAKSDRERLVKDLRTEIILLSIALICLYSTLSYVYLSWIEMILVHIHIILFTVYSYAKELILVDTLLVAVAWSVPLITVAVFYTNSSVSFFGGLIAGVAMLLMKSGETELSNIRDRTADKEAGHPTLPNTLGTRNTIIFSTATFSISILIILLLIPRIVFLPILVISFLLIYVYLTHSNKSVERILAIDRIGKILIGLLCVLSVY